MHSARLSLPITRTFSGGSGTGRALQSETSSKKGPNDVLEIRPPATDLNLAVCCAGGFFLNHCSNGERWGSFSVEDLESCVEPLSND